MRCELTDVVSGAANTMACPHEQQLGACCELTRRSLYDIADMFCDDVLIVGAAVGVPFRGQDSDVFVYTL